MPNTAPTVVTLEEIHRIWEPQGWRFLPIGPTATWRQEWGEWEAIRDIIQNSLDETESYTSGYDPQGLWIQDMGRGVQVADFLLGPPKLKPPYARGRFGEGLKIAALALLRNGYPLKVETVGKEVWMVFVAVPTDGVAHQLGALWRPNGWRQGTRFHIIGYTGPDYRDRFAVNIPSRDILHLSPSPVTHPFQRFNALIAKPPGRIYARDIYMTDIDSPWSYNLWGFEMAPDRHGPKEESELRNDIGRTWATVASSTLIQELLPMLTDPPQVASDENEYLAFDRMGMEPKSKEWYSKLLGVNAVVWQRAWDAAFGADTVILTDPKYGPMVAHLDYRMVNTNYSVRETLARVVRSDAALVRQSQERLRQVQIIPDSALSEKQLRHLRLARAIANQVVPAWMGKAQGVYAAIIPPASDRVRTAGLYSGTITQEVYLSADQLDSAINTVDTLIHELAHHTSGGEEDLTEGHSSAMSALAGKVVAYTAAGYFNESLVGVIWS